MLRQCAGWQDDSGRAVLRAGAAQIGDVANTAITVIKKGPLKCGRLTQTLRQELSLEQSYPFSQLYGTSTRRVRYQAVLNLIAWVVRRW